MARIAPVIYDWAGSEVTTRGQRPDRSIRRRRLYGAGLSILSEEFWVGLWHANSITPQTDNTGLAAWPEYYGRTSWTGSVGTTAPMYRTSYRVGDSQPSVEFTAASSQRMVADSLAAQFVGTLPLYMFAACIVTDAPGTKTLMSLGRNSTTGYAQLAGNMLRSDDSGNNDSCLSSVSSIPGTSELRSLRYTGTAIQLAFGQFHFDSTAADGGVMTPTRLTLGALRRNTTTLFWDGRIVACGLSLNVPTDAQIAELYEWIAGGTVRGIMCCGDSITAGPADTGGYRQQFWVQCDEVTPRADMVGPIGDWGDYAHRFCAASPGRTIDEIRVIINDALLTSIPSLFVIHAGTNDAYGTYNETIADAAQAQYAGMLDDIYAAAPNARIAVTPIIPINLAGKELNALDLNARLQGTGAYAGIGVFETFEAAHPGVLVYWDARQAIGGFENYDDELHPNAAGFELMLNHATFGLWQAVESIVGAW